MGRHVHLLKRMDFREELYLDVTFKSVKLRKAFTKAKRKKERPIADEV